MLRQKDLDARWTKKNSQSHYGYKNHINIDRTHKLIREYTVTDAARHDSQELETVLDPDNTASDVWADSAYRSAEIEQTLKDRGLRSRIHRKGNRRRKLTKREKQGNKTRSTVRVRVEHVFGHFMNSMGGKLVRTIGAVRARTKIGLHNLTYNMKRFVCLEGMKAVAALLVITCGGNGLISRTIATFGRMTAKVVARLLCDQRHAAGSRAGGPQKWRFLEVPHCFQGDSQSRLGVGDGVKVEGAERRVMAR